MKIPPPLKIVTGRPDDVQKKRPHRIGLRVHRKLQLRTGNGSNRWWRWPSGGLAAVPVKTAAERTGMGGRRTEALARTADALQFGIDGSRFCGHWIEKLEKEVNSLVILWTEFPFCEGNLWKKIRVFVFEAFKGFSFFSFPFSFFLFPFLLLFFLYFYTSQFEV